MPLSPGAERVESALQRVVEALALKAEVVVEETEESIHAALDGEDLGLFIGRRGQTIDAVQHLVHRIALQHGGEEARRRVEIDAAGYRERRADALREQADEAADEAVRYGRPVALDAMGAHERRLVHEHLRDREDVETHSEGEEPDRHLVVEPAS